MRFLLFVLEWMTIYFAFWNLLKRLPCMSSDGLRWQSSSSPSAVIQRYPSMIPRLIKNNLDFLHLLPPVLSIAGLHLTGAHYCKNTKKDKHSHSHTQLRVPNSPHAFLECGKKLVNLLRTYKVHRGRGSKPRPSYCELTAKPTASFVAHTLSWENLLVVFPFPKIRRNFCSSVLLLHRMTKDLSFSPQKTVFMVC